MTLAASKQLLPVYDKPMIYYPLSTLMMAGISEFLIITTPHEQEDFIRLLGDGSQWGISLSYAEQESPKGIAEALILGEKFISGRKLALILGDNLLYGSGLGKTLARMKDRPGATVFAYQVADPSRYGVVEFEASGKALSIEEKPDNPKSQFAVPGLYFYDQRAVELARELTPSKRGELEITDLNNKYLDFGELYVERMSRGTVWLDMGTVDSLHEASQFVSVMERRQGTKICVPEEIAWQNNWITKQQLRIGAQNYKNSEYGAYLLKLLESEAYT